jgi:hypothetical protein
VKETAVGPLLYPTPATVVEGLPSSDYSDEFPRWPNWLSVLISFSNKITGLLALYFRSEVVSMSEPKEVITSFRRIEAKYLLDEAQKEGLLKVLEQHMEYDSYSQAGGHYSVKNIYFDTPTNNVIRESSEGPLYKAKLRLRTYGERASALFPRAQKEVQRRSLQTPDHLERTRIRRFRVEGGLAPE